jgi:hypothetical protein
MLTVAAISLAPKALRLPVAVLWDNIPPLHPNNFRRVDVYCMGDVT